ncbi:MAG: ABC transporter ATP-binding protein [Blastochloris sp.]|nr:ABC transporter ATP-binding protein [Blastochloris sp.]
MNVLLETHDLSIGYQVPHRPSVVIARDLQLRLSLGEIVCLIGPNGAGKSTLMRTLAGMQKPLGGRVLLGNQELHRLLPIDRAKRLGIVLTERPNVGLLSGYALVALGRHPYSDWTGRLTRYDEAVIHWAVDAVGAGDLAERPVMELSDGQRQKLMIARALAQEPELILLDEPTAFLDLPRRVEMMQLLKHLTRETGRTVLLSTHELDLALRTADAIWLMSDGIVRMGTPEDLILNRAFESAFQSEGLNFNRETGTFNTNHQMGRVVAVIGSNVAYTWTCRALERAGFTLAQNGTVPDICIEVQGNDDQPDWRLSSGSTQTTYTSIHDLLQALNQKEETDD